MKVVKKTQQILKDRDFLGNEFKLTHDGGDNFRTATGGCISILVFLAAMSVIFEFLYQYFDPTSPVVLESIERQSKYPEFDLYKHRYAPLFHIRMDDSIPLKDYPKFITGYLKIFIMKEVQQNFRAEAMYIPLVPCNDGNKRLSQYFMEDEETSFFAKNFAYCVGDTLDPEMYKVSSQLPRVPYQSIDYILMPCSLPNPADCATRDQIVEAQLAIGNIIYSFKPGNLLHPLDPIVNFDALYSFDYENTLYITQNLQKVQVLDDKLDFGGPYLREEFISVESTFSSIKTRNGYVTHCPMGDKDHLDERDRSCAPYFQFTVQAGGAKKTILRTYPKFMDTLGNIGGIFEITAFIGSLLYFFCREKSYKQYNQQEILRKNLEDYQKVFTEQKVKDLEKSMGSLISWQKDANRLIRKLANLEIIEEALLEDEHTSLIPLVMMARELERQKILSESKEFPARLVAEGIKQAPKHMPFEDAYSNLKNRNRGGIKGEIDEIFIRELKPLMEKEPKLILMDDNLNPKIEEVGVSDQKNQKENPNGIQVEQLEVSAFTESLKHINVTSKRKVKKTKSKIMGVQQKTNKQGENKFKRTSLKTNIKNE